MSKIKNCPFCGSTAEAQKDDECGFYCVCTNYDGCGVKTDFYTNKKYAIAAWNTRSDGWISTKERLPDVNKSECDVPLWLCDDTGKVFEGICFVRLADSSKCFFRHSADGTKPGILTNITHFQIMNIPCDPKEKEADE